MKINEGRGILASRYLVALLAPAFIAGVMQVTWPFFEHTPIVLYILAIMFCGWFGGPGPGFLSLLVSVLLIDLLFVESYFGLWPRQRVYAIRLVILITVGMVSNMLSLWIHREKRRAKANLDLTRRAEAAQRESEANYRLLFEGNPLPMWVYDLETLVFIAVNKSAIDHYGYSREEFLAMTIKDIQTPEPFNSPLEQISETSDALPAVGTWRHLKKNGSVIEVEMTLHAIEFSGKPARLVLANDITDRKRMEDAIQASEESLARAQQIAHIGNWEWDLLTGEVRWSEEMYGIYGISREEFGDTFESVARFNHPDDRERVNRHIEAGLSQRKPQNFDYRIVRPDGTIRVINAQSQVYLDESGSPVKSAGTLQDITERKRMEDLLSEKERFINQIAELSPAVISVFDLATGRDIYISPDVERLLGYTPKEIAEMENPLSTLWHPEDIPGANEIMAELKPARDGEIVEFEYRVRRRDGEWRWVATRAMPFERDEDGVVQVVTVSIDITERKQVERAQRESHKQYETLVQSIDGIVWEADPRTFIFTFVSKQAERILGFPLERWFEGPDFWPDHMHPEDRDWAVAFCVNATNRREDHQFEYRMIAADGQVVWLNDIVTVHIVDDQTVLLRGVMVDITESKRTEEKLKQSEKQLAEAQHMASVGSWNYDLQANSHTWSDEAFRICGLHPRESHPSYATFIELVHPDDREIIKEALKHALKTQEQIDCYLRIIRPDGEERIIHSRGNAISDLNGSPTRMHGTVQDVTERKQAEDELRKQKEILQKIFDYSPVMITFIGADGRTKLVNREWEQIMGWSSEEVTSGDLDVFSELHPDPAYREEVLEYIAKANTQWADFKTRVRDGRILDTRWSNVLLSDGTSIGIGRDITAWKSAEAELRESEERYRDLVESSEELICTHDLQGLVLSANRAAAVSLGYPPKEYPVTMNLRDCLAPEVRDQFDDYLNTVQKEGFAKGLMVVQTSTGERRIWEYYNTLRTEGVATPIVRGMAHDITERRRAEEALRHAERKYRAIFENAGEGIFQSTPDGRFLAANPALARMYGFDSPEELIRSLTDISRQIYVDPKRREEFKHLLDAFGMVRGFEHQVLRKDGTMIWTSVNARVVRDEQDTIRYYEGTAQDVTDRKQAEEALRESEERYRELFENAKDAIYVQDLRGIYTSVNRAAEKLSGYTRNEIIGKHFEQFVAPEYLPLVRTNFAKKLVDKEQTAYEVDVLAKDGQRVPVELNSTLIFEHDVPVGIQGIARDITKRKRAEDDLRQQKEILQKIFDHIPVMIRLTGPDGNVHLVNREYERTTGWSLAEIQGKGLNLFAELYPDKNERQLIIERVATPRGDWADFRTTVRDGRVIDTTWTNIHLSAGMSLGIGQDISDRKRAEETLRSYSRKLIEAQEAERQHIARELHDQIGQVLTAIRINLQTIGNSCETDESQVLIHQGISIIDSALEQVRNLSFELRPSLLDGLGLVAALRWYSDQYARRTGIRTKTSTNLREGQTRLREELETACFRIVQEALTNVVRHANAKNVSVSLRKLDHQILLSIKDDGIGFDERSANGGASPIHLGLRGMKERALALSGTLAIESAPTRGTEIRASFPINSKED
jgi:PAS domain S-box-containing protein